MKLTIIGIAAFAAVLQACVLVPQRIALNQTDRDVIRNVDLYNLIIQDEVRPAVGSSIAVGAVVGAGMTANVVGSAVTGVVGSAVNRSGNISAQNMMEPLYQVTDTLDYRALMAKEINASIGSIYTLRAKKDLAETKLLSNSDLQQKIQQLQEGEYLLYISTSYSLIDDYKSFASETAAVVFKKTAGSQSSGMPKPVYSNKFIYFSESLGKGDRDSIELWSKNKGEIFARALAESASEAARYLKYDLQIKGSECGKLVPVYIFGSNGEKMDMYAQFIQQNSTRAAVRNTIDGSIYSIPGVLNPKLEKIQKCKK